MGQKSRSVRWLFAGTLFRTLAIIRQHQDYIHYSHFQRVNVNL